MHITDDTPIATLEQLQRLIGVAADDPTEDPGPLVRAFTIGGIFSGGSGRLQAAVVLLTVSQLTTDQLQTLISSVRFTDADDTTATLFVDRLLDHPAMSPSVVVSLFHIHSTALRDLSPALNNPGDLSVAVALATAERGSVRTNDAVRFIEHVLAHAPDGVCQQLAYVLADDQWVESLWTAYGVSCALQGYVVESSPADEFSWSEPLERLQKA